MLCRPLLWRGSSKEGRPEEALHIVSDDAVVRPFAQPAMSMISRATPSTVPLIPTHLLPALLAAAWLCGFAASLPSAVGGRRFLAVMMVEAVPSREGRDVEALRRLENLVEVRKRIEMVRGRAPLEVGIFGLVRPLLERPGGISDALPMCREKAFSRTSYGTWGLIRWRPMSKHLCSSLRPFFLRRRASGGGRLPIRKPTHCPVLIRLPPSLPLA